MGHLHKKYSTTNERKKERRKGRMNPITKIFGDDTVCGWNILKIERWLKWLKIDLVGTYIFI